MGTVLEKANKIKETKNKLKEIINDGGGQITNDTVFNDYADEIKNIYIDAINNGIENIYNNFPKITEEGSKIILDTEEGPMKITLKGNTSQDEAPTPDTPVPIKVVTGNQNIEISGKNLFDKSTAVTGYINADGSISSNNNYVTTDYISIDSSLQYSKTATNSPRIKLYDKDKNLLDTSSYNDISSFGNQGTYTIPNVNAKYIRFTIRIGTSYSDINTVMFVKGSTLPTLYEPYYIPQTYPINLGSLEYCKIGDYSDEFYLDNGNWYIRKNIGKYILPSNVGGYNTSNNWFYIGLSNFSNIATSGSLLSNYFSNISLVQNPNSNGISRNGTTHIIIRNTALTSADEYKAWLSNNETIMYATLATPTSEAITDTTLIEQLENINNNAKSYSGTTIIECSSSTDDNETIQISTIALKKID